MKTNMPKSDLVILIETLEKNLDEARKDNQRLRQKVNCLVRRIRKMSQSASRRGKLVDVD